MKKREKILGVTILAVAIVAGGIKFGPSVLGALSGGTSVAELQSEYDKIADKNEKELFALVEEYKDLGGKTLGRTAESVKTRLDLEIKRLVGQCELSTPRYFPKRETKVKKSDMLIIPYNLSAEGTLRSVVTFLGRFYNQPYLWGIKTLTLTPADAKGADRVRLSADIETLVLPALDLKLKDAKGKPMEDPLANYAVAKTDPAERHGSMMTDEQLASAYGEIWAEQFFTPYKPPPPPKPKPPKPPVIKTPTAPVVKRPTVPRVDPKWAQTTLVGVMQVDGVYEAILNNKQKNMREYVRMGDECAGGTIILVHPRALVVRKRDAKNYVFPRGSLLSPGKLLTDEEFPEIFYTVARSAL